MIPKDTALIECHSDLTFENKYQTRMRMETDLDKQEKLSIEMTEEGKN
jgi:hypothetical protein